MAHILITSGPTRQYLDPVRYLTNASSGRMGEALATAALQAGHRVTVVSGPVAVRYPPTARVIPVLTTDQMMGAAAQEFPHCDGFIGVAAPCDYRPVRVEDQKIAKTGEPLVLHLIETTDIVATLGARKRPDQWVVGFALESEDRRFRALRKMEEKSCDLIVINAPSAMDSPHTEVEVLDRDATVVGALAGSKLDVARQLIRIIEQRLMPPAEPRC